MKLASSNVFCLLETSCDVWQYTGLHEFIIWGREDLEVFKSRTPQLLCKS